MITKHLGLLAAGALLASIGGANAGQVTLTDAQLDRVTAGASALVEAYGQNIFSRQGIFYLYANEGLAYAQIFVDVVPIGNSPHTISVYASASTP